MSTPAFNTDNFRSEMATKDFARSHRYEVQFFAPRIVQTGTEVFRQFSLFTEDALIPGTLLGTKPIRLNNMNYQRATAIDFNGDSISFGFVVDSTWLVKNVFTDWMEKIVNPIDREVAFPEDYYSEILIHALDQSDNILATWKLYDAFPRSVAPVQVSYGNTQIVRLPVTFTFRKWTLEFTANDHD
jgi:hypothetical protein